MQRNGLSKVLVVQPICVWRHVGGNDTFFCRPLVIDLITGEPDEVISDLDSSGFVPLLPWASQGGYVKVEPDYIKLCWLPD